MHRVVAVLALAVAMILTAVPVSAQETLELGIPLPLTGAQAKFGEIQKKSYDIAAEEINAKGGIKGKKVVLRYEDSQGKPEVARSIAEKLIDVNKQPIVFGEYSSSCSKAVAAVAEERKTPYLVVTGAADDITQKNYNFVYRLCPSNAYYALGLMDFFKNVVKPTTMAILYESSDFGTSGADEMEKLGVKEGVKTVLKEKYEKGAVDFKPILSKVKAAQPDVIFMVSYVMDAALLMRQIKELRIDSKIFAGGAAGFAIPEFVENAKDAAEFVVTATLWSPQMPYTGAKEFAEKYKKAHGQYPSYHGAEAYAALFIVKEALEKAASMSAADINASLNTVDMMTAFGPVKFVDKDGYQNQNFMDTLVLQVIGGKHETIWPQKFASKPHIFPIPAWRERK